MNATMTSARHIHIKHTPKLTNSITATILIPPPQLVTAFWHGVYPGYFIFFISTVFYLQSARTIYRAEQTVLPGWLVGSSLWWLIKVRPRACLMLVGPNGSGGPGG
eukprot:364569-Chlamydomonas_euryale.AAC.19